ncbi:MAG: hypothetical protein WKG01_04280 [Kofleriaceae bacterium]
MDDASTRSPHLPTATTCFPDSLPVRERRLARATQEHNEHEGRAMLAASVGAVPAPRLVMIAPRLQPAHEPSIDPELLAILDAPLFPGETTFAGFARKEAAIGAACAQLAVSAARALHARLAFPKHGDALAEKFARLTVDRRRRILMFLADARRREAISARR